MRDHEEPAASLCQRLLSERLDDIQGAPGGQVLHSDDHCRALFIQRRTWPAWLGFQSELTSATAWRSEATVRNWMSASAQSAERLRMTAAWVDSTTQQLGYAESGEFSRAFKRLDQRVRRINGAGSVRRSGWTRRQRPWPSFARGAQQRLRYGGRKSYVGPRVGCRFLDE